MLTAGASQRARALPRGVPPVNAAHMSGANDLSSVPVSEGAKTPAVRTNVIPFYVVLGRALQRTVGGLKVLLPLVLVIGGLGHLVMYYAGLATAPFAGADQFSKLLYSEVAKLIVGTIWGVFLFPILDAATIYVWRRADEGADATLYAALNWALARYGRMLKPHAISYVTIALGMVVIVPGVLFGLQYAFVSAITATDDRSKAPLARSQKLTAGRRGKIMLSWIPYALWYLPAYLWLVYEAEGMGWHAVLLFGAVDMLLLVVMEMAMYGLYVERIDDARRVQEATARDATPALEG